MDLETDTPDLLARLDEGVAVITLNRPDRRNALSVAMIDALGAVLRQVEANDEVGAVLLTGAGEAFCSGGDVRGMAAGDQEPPYDTRIQQQQLNQAATCGRLWEMPKPTIAALPGAAVGAGFGLALSCDLRYAAPSAVLTTGFSKVGLPGDFGGTWFLNRLVGSAKAKELYFLSARIDAQEAVQLGIVNAVHTADSLQEEAFVIARQLASGPRIALRYMKENLNRAVAGGLRECMDIEAVHHARARRTEDHREAVSAFVDKRRPVFAGR